MRMESRSVVLKGVLQKVQKGVLQKVDTWSLRGGSHTSFLGGKPVNVNAKNKEGITACLCVQSGQCFGSPYLYL